MASEALTLYKQLLRYSTRMASYNFRQYAVRRTRDGFLSNRNLSDPEQIRQEIAKGWEQLEVLRRQSAISRMYKGDRLVVETL
uniref:ARAD1C04026p n=1 Tax=Blastobotrys adeninivorans TaxID=409370 RepID=A0A060T5A5_BLAAD